MIGRRNLALAGMAAVLASLGAQAMAAEAPKPDFAAAYAYAMRCFVADGIAIPKAADDPDGTRAGSMRRMARKAFDTAYLLGGKLGYSEQRISADFDRAQGVEMRLLMQNPDYLARTRTDCIRLGLM